MSIFQKSVIKKYLKNLDNDKVNTAFEQFQKFYGDKLRLFDILHLKEENFQEGFLREIFVQVLGYTLRPDRNFNLTTEYKNQTDSKKADGAIIRNNSAIGVIELKSAKTFNLENIKNQAFNYKNNQPDCRYVITSNFHYLRLYIDNSTEYEEFDLFEMATCTDVACNVSAVACNVSAVACNVSAVACNVSAEFKKFYLILSQESIFNDVPLKMKDETKFHEESISEKFYKDYKQFRDKIFNNLIKNNPQYDKLTLFKKTQKLLDRFIFIWFAEDTGLVAPNMISNTIQKWKNLLQNDEYFSLFSRFQKAFHYLNVGYTFQSTVYPAFNGGLFQKDDIIDKPDLIIDDDVLQTDCLKISAYDFNTDLDVNILGHIFEHSLNEIEEIQRNLQGFESLEGLKTSKRKKEGIFYTPKYITNYIIENTIGKICKEKQIEIQIADIEIDETYTKKGKITKLGKELFVKFQEYKDWLFALKIIDPACGSGAFLNAALDYLINEHRQIDNLINLLKGEQIRMFDTDKSILENNIFGVDINEESVEIAKLSLWLRTAHKDRKLSDLNNNIKCGNSLIDQSLYAGNKAFNWNIEFSEIIDKGGFDVVIGNPPYVRAELLGSFRNYLKENYIVFNPSSDLFSFFYEKSFKILKKDTGLLGFISNTFDKTTAGFELRQYLQNETVFEKYVDFTEVQIFEGATTYPVIIISKKQANIETNTFDYIRIPKNNQANIIDIKIHLPVKVTQSKLDIKNWTFKSNFGNGLIKRILMHPTVLQSYGKCYYGVKTALNEAFIYGKCYRGILTGLNEAFIISKKYPISEHIKPIFEGKDIQKWNSPESEQQLILFPSKWTRRTYGNNITEIQAIQNLKSDFPELINHLLQFEEKARKRADKGDFFWELRNCAYYDLFEKPKIIFPNLQNSNKFAFDEKGIYINAPAVILPTTDKFLLAILNSKIVWYFLKSICVVRSGGYIEVKPQYFEQIPIPEITEVDKRELTKKTEYLIEQTKEMQNAKSQFEKLIKSRWNKINWNRKFENWFDLKFGDFTKELEKQKIKLLFNDQADLMQFFEQEKNKINNLQLSILQNEKEVERKVYKLYNLSPEDIVLVEGII